MTTGWSPAGSGNELDLSQILISAQSKDPRGEKGFDPRMEAQLSAQRLTMLLL